MRKKSKVTAEMLLDMATDGLLYDCYQVILDNGKHPFESIKRGENNGVPFIEFNNLAAASEGNIRKFFNEKPWLADMIIVEYQKFQMLLVCKVYLKAEKKDYDFWYGYLMMKQNG